MDLRLKIKDGVATLERNGNPVTCPYATRLLVPGNMANTINLNVSPCSSLCSLFEYWKDGTNIKENTNTYTVSLCKKAYTKLDESFEKASISKLLFPIIEK